MMADRRRGKMRPVQYQWLDDLHRDPKVRAGARHLALVLVSKFRNRETGQCNPGNRVLAREANVSEKTVTRRMNALEDRGWIRRVAGGAPNKTGQIALTCPSLETESDPSPERQTKRIGTRDSSVVPPIPPYKDKPLSNQMAHTNIFIDITERTQLDAWDSWLENEGYPPHENLCEPHTEGTRSGWMFPSRWPPDYSGDCAKTRAYFNCRLIQTHQRGS